MSKIMFGSVSIILEGNASPITTIVHLNDKTIEPSGQGGQTYTARVRPGDYKLVVAGPYIERSETDVSIGFQQSRDITLQTVIRRRDKIAADTLDATDNTPVSSILSFGDGSWMVVSKEAADASSDRILHVLRFNYGDGKWRLVTSGAKIDTQEPGLRNAPTDLMEFLTDESGY